MSNPTTSEVLPAACTTITSVIKAAAGADLAASTPCTEFSLRALLTHFTGTTGAFAHAGKTRSLNPNDPWGSMMQLDEDDWPSN